MNLLLARCVPYTFNDHCLAIRDYVRTEDVQHLLGWIRAHAQQPNHNRTCGVGAWMRAVFQNGGLRYIKDPEHCDLWSRPSVTLQRGGGDCDDLAILGGTLCRAVGIYTEFVVGMLKSRGQNLGPHLWVEGTDENGFFLLEATNGHHFCKRSSDYEPWYFLTPERCVRASERSAPSWGAAPNGVSRVRAR